MKPSSTRPESRASRGAFQGAMGEREVEAAVESYSRQLSAVRADGGSDGAAGLARSYYELVTDFYEYGWGQSFHFAPRRRGESVPKSLERCEEELARKLGLRAGMRALDVGCGVGGPMRTVARCSGASVTGITISPYQIGRARRHNERAALTRLCDLVEGDFHAMPFADGTFDAAYTLEACCHATDRRGPFAEVFRVLKPGAMFAGHDWCMTPRYRPLDPEHDRIKQGIQKGNGVADLLPSSELDRALSDVGFENLQTGDSRDQADPDAPWYLPLAAGASLRGFRNSRAGGFLTHQLVRILEAVGASPKGTVEVHDVLRLAQRALVEGGQTGIFTPMYAWLARKPASASR